MNNSKTTTRGPFAYLTEMVADDDLTGKYSADRTKILAQYHSRMSGHSFEEVSAQELSKLINQLNEKDCIIFREGEEGCFDIYYNPSSRPIESVCRAEGNIWPTVISKRASKLVWRTEGALFKLPVENGDEALSVFVTDWSSCTASCAVALHPTHKFLGSLNLYGKESASFTGQHVRHPITGDFLAVWVADWVKPDFGTGAVLINPGHNASDLRFAREVGLPIRFALHPEGSSDDQKNWPNPPVIRSGKAVRAGIFDGMSAAEVQSVTIEMLIESGLAKPHTDVSIPSILIAKLYPDPDGGLSIGENGIELESESGENTTSTKFFLKSYNLLDAAASISIRNANEVYVSSRATKREAVYLAVILNELLNDDLNLKVELVQGVEGKVPLEQGDHISLALLVGEVKEKPLVLRDQLLQQAKEFLKNSEKIRTSATSDLNEVPTKIEKTMEDGNLVSGYRELHKWQKTMIQSGDEINSESYSLLIGKLLPNSDW